MRSYLPPRRGLPDRATLRSAADRLAPFTSAQHGVVLAEQARAVLGVSGMITAERSGALARLWYGVYAVPPVTLDVRLHAADLTFGASQRPCLETAAAIYGFDLSGDQRLHLLTGGDTVSTRPELVQHRIRPVSPMMRYRGRDLMGSSETACRVAARQATAPATLAVLDAALASQAVARPEQLVVMAGALSINGIRRVRQLAPCADAGAESPRESWLRWLFLESGLPRPVTQFWVQPRPGVRYRLDLAWPDYKVACEYDGTAFHTGEALRRDRQRLNDLVADRWLVTSAAGVMLSGPDRGARLVRQVEEMLRRRGARI